MAYYDDIGPCYDVTRRVDPYLAGRLIAHLDLQPGQRYLDLGCGTGNYTLEMARRSVAVLALDESPTMLAQAAAKSAFSNITWILAQAELLPLANACVRGISCFLAHHHFKDLDQAFAEVLRVLESGGRFVLFNTAPDQLRGFWLAQYFPRVMEQAIRQCERLQTERRLGDAGFTIIKNDFYTVSPDLRDWFLYCGKHHPERYLEPRVRAGISAFEAMRDSPEISTGCARLAEDIATGRFKQVASSYQNDRGDYTFWIAQKP
jgi:ubiquinone/menaquinone biosynthesis C-methylase UbiE